MGIAHSDHIEISRRYLWNENVKQNMQSWEEITEFVIIVTIYLEPWARTAAESKSILFLILINMTIKQQNC